MISPAFWSGRKVLLTGHTGFKGSWLALWLHRLGADVTALALPPVTSPNLFELAKVGELVASHFCDIRDQRATRAIVEAAQPEIIFHLAAQPLVRLSYRQPVETFATNVLGTVHILEAARAVDSLRAMVMVTTDKVYRNNEWPWPYREDDILGGHDPYSASKAASEIVIDSYRKSFLQMQGAAVASARAGNVIGGGDWSEDRLIPDAVRAWRAGKPLEIRRPESVRPWQHVLEPLAGYLRLAQAIHDNPSAAGAYNFGPEVQDAATVRAVIDMARQIHGGGAQVNYAQQQEGPHEAGLLMLDISKARRDLGISPRWNLAESVRRTIAWYAGQQRGNDARALCEQDIGAWEEAQ